MAFKVYSLEELRLEWEILVPQSNLTLRSPVFFFGGSEWRFELKTAWNAHCQDDMWTIKIENADQKNDCHKFKVEVVAENKAGDFYLLTVVKVKYPFSENLTLLERRKSFFFQYFSNVKEKESIILFFTIFNSIFSKDEPNKKSKPLFGVSNGSHERNVSDSKDAVIVSDSTKENKLTQTPSCMNVLPCLQSLSVDMYKLMTSDSQHDAEFRCGDGIFPVHRLIIGARSEVLKTMLQSDMIGNHAGSISVDDRELPVFKHFLRYLYTGILPELTTDMAIELYDTGEKYVVDSLKRRCSNFLKSNLGRNNAFKILTVANAHNDADLKEETIIFILEKEMHLEEDEWTAFCDDKPKIAIEVLSRALKFSKYSK